MSAKDQIKIDRCLLINNIRRKGVASAFEKGRGRRALVLISPFPFMVIGRIVKVTCDYLFISAETTHIAELEGTVIRIHLGDVDVFYIEGTGGPGIPVVSNGCNNCDYGEGM